MASDDLPGAVKGAALLLIGIAAGGAAGYLWQPEAEPAPQMVHDHSKHAHADGHQGHGQMWEWSGNGSPPTLSLAVEPDPVSGWNLHAMTENFRFSPETSGLAPAPGEGHGHLYVNGDKIARLYGPWFHIGQLPKGEAEITVTLNTNDHQTIAVSGSPLEARLTVTVE